MPKSCTCRESYVKKLSCNMLFGKKLWVKVMHIKRCAEKLPFDSYTATNL